MFDTLFTKWWLLIDIVLVFINVFVLPLILPGLVGDVVCLQNLVL